MIPLAPIVAVTLLLVVAWGISLAAIVKKINSRHEKARCVACGNRAKK